MTIPTEKKKIRARLIFMIIPYIKSQTIFDRVQSVTDRATRIHTDRQAQTNMSHVMRKPVFAICEQQRRRSVCASAQSDQRIRAV